MYLKILYWPQPFFRQNFPPYCTHSLMYYKHCFKVWRYIANYQTATASSWVTREKLNISEWVVPFIVKEWFKRVWLVSSAVEIMYTYPTLYYHLCVMYFLPICWKNYFRYNSNCRRQLFTFFLSSVFAAGAGLGESTNEISWRKTSFMVVTVMCI